MKQRMVQELCTSVSLRLIKALSLKVAMYLDKSVVHEYMYQRTGQTSLQPVAAGGGGGSGVGEVAASS